MGVEFFLISINLFPLKFLNIINKNNFWYTFIVILNQTTKLYAFVSMGIISYLLSLTAFENNQQIYQLFLFRDDNYFKVWAAEEEEEDSIDEKICNKYFVSETCEKIKENKPVEKKELNEEEMKAEAILNKYLEPVESENKSINNSINGAAEIGSSSSITDNSLILSNNLGSTDTNNSSKQIKNELLIPQQKTNQSSVKNPNVSINLRNLEYFTQVQLVDLISSEISNAGHIDKNKVTMSINDFIEPTEAEGGNVLGYLKQIAKIVLKDPSGNIANKIINLTKTK